MKQLVAILALFAVFGCKSHDEPTKPAKPSTSEPKSTDDSKCPPGRTCPKP